MSKLLSRLSLSKVLFCVILQDFELEITNLEQNESYPRFILDCKRGKFRKKI